MHLQVVRVEAVAKPQGQRPAKVVQLEARRQARLDATRREQELPKRAA